jgi:hypothetical protein
MEEIVESRRRISLESFVFAFTATIFRTWPNSREDMVL